MFNTSLSEEYQLAASTFDLQPSDLWRLSLSSIDSAFCDEQSKEKLRGKWKLCKSHIEKRFNLKLWKSSGYQTQKAKEIYINTCSFVLFFMKQILIVCNILFSVRSKILHSYGDVNIAGDWLQMFDLYWRIFQSHALGL